MTDPNTNQPADASNPGTPDGTKSAPQSNAEAITDAKENNPLFMGEKTDQRRDAPRQAPDMSVNNNTGVSGENLDGSPNPALGLRHGFDPRTGQPIAALNQPQAVDAKGNKKSKVTGQIEVDGDGKPVSSARSWDDMDTNEKLDALKNRLDAQDRLQQTQFGQRRYVPNPGL